LNNGYIPAFFDNIVSDKSIFSIFSVVTIYTGTYNDLTYYYNDVIDQTKINESAYNIVNQVDKIDYSNVKTGLEKCLEKCDGTCFELGYMGIATCFPKQTKSFDLGTLYKNPTFTYGYNAFKNKQ
jgi:predicted RNase H-like nuclease